jgi:hypothetical protein
LRLFALLAFYDERPEDLALYLQSIKTAGVDHLVAVDGRYALFPGDEASSHHSQHMMLTGGCRELAIGLTLHVPTVPWAGNEPEKRTALFRLAWTVSEPADWWFVLDTDELVRDAPDALTQRLEASRHDVAEVTVCDTLALAANKPNWPTHFKQRRVFRAQPIHLTHSHATYYSSDGRVLGLDPSDEPCMDLTDVTVWHAPQRRSSERQQAKAGYYAARDGSGVECGTCRCGAPAVEKIERDWRLTPAGPVADIVECCGACALRTRRRNEKRMARLGIDPATVAHRYGKAPGPVV